MGLVLVPLTPTAVLTTGTAPARGKINIYDATAGSLTAPLPALSAMSDGDQLLLVKYAGDNSANTITFNRAGADTFLGGGTSTTLTDATRIRHLEVITISSTKYWTTTGGFTKSAYDLSIVAFGANTTRAASSYGDFPFGVKLQRAATFTSVTFRVNTADASGNLVVELRKNGATVSGTSTTIAAASQVAGGTSTGSWSFAAGDIVTVYIAAAGVGTTPGNGLIADIQGTA